MENDYITVDETAKYLNRTKRHVCWLCIRKLPGAKKFGEKVWAIPRKSVEEYEPGLQGFAVVKSRKEKAKASWLAELNAAIKHYGSPKLVTA